MTPSNRSHFLYKNLQIMYKRDQFLQTETKSPNSRPFSPQPRPTPPNQDQFAKSASKKLKPKVISLLPLL